MPEWKSQFLKSDFLENMEFYHKFRYSNEFIWWILVQFTGLPSNKDTGDQIFKLFEDLCDGHNAGPGK